METTVHISYPSSGIEMSEFKRILSVLEKADELYHDPEDDETAGRIVRVQEGSIILKIIWKILPSAIPYLSKYLLKRLTKNSQKSQTDVSINLESNNFSLNIIYKRKDIENE